jgi:hypothetical protein
MRVLALTLATALTAAAGCVSFAPAANPTCPGKSDIVRWVNEPSEKSLTERLGRPAYDPSLDAPEFGSGIPVHGAQHFRFTAAGRHLVEIFIANPEKDRFTFRLSSGERVLDERPMIAPGPGRLRPKRGLRHTSLLAMADGPADLEIRSEAPKYTLLAIRWTPASQFESELVPKWRERLQYLQTHILTHASGYPNPTVRRAWIQQLGDRLEFSDDPNIQRDALLARTRAWFWLAAENHEPDDLLQTSVLFQTGLRTIPCDLILRQMVSAACLGQVVRMGQMPTGNFCRDVKPVPWSVEMPPAVESAPEWAVSQRQLSRRMDAITRWWVTQRQSPGGELGGGWGDDVEILRYWGPQALGFSSAVAERGTLNIAGGLWNSGTLLHGYDRHVSDVEHSSEPTTDTQPLAAALRPEDPEIIARLKQTAACADQWVQQQPDGAVRFRSSWFNCREADTSDSHAVDVHLNTRAMGPALWYAYLTRDPHLIELLSKWADSWIYAMRRNDHGKPRGVIPPVLRSKDGLYLIGSKRWDKPDAEWDYFQWSGGSQEAVTSLILAVYDLTGNQHYLNAAGESFEPLADCAPHPDICAQMRRFPEAFYTWRHLTGDSSYDTAFGYRTSDNETDLLQAMMRQARESVEYL